MNNLVKLCALSAYRFANHSTLGCMFHPLKHVRAAVAAGNVLIAVVH